MSKGLFSVLFHSKFQEDERPIVKHLQQETAYSHVVLAAAQCSWKVASNKLGARLAGKGDTQLHCSSLAQHTNPIPSHHASCSVANKHSSQRLLSCAELQQGSGCRHSLSSSLTDCPPSETPNALASNKSLQLRPLLELTSCGQL